MFDIVRSWPNFEFFLVFRGKKKNHLDVIDNQDVVDNQDVIDNQKQNPQGNGKSEFEDGTGDVNFETIKIEIYNDDDWQNLKETMNL